MLNPYAPPSADPAASQLAGQWKRAPIALAWAEILAGLAIGLWGCGAGLATDASLALVGAAYVFVIAFVALVLPGVVLLEVRHPARWLAQAIPLALVVMAIVWHGGRT